MNILYLLKVKNQKIYHSSDIKLINAICFKVQLADAVKRGACSLGSNQPESQVMVINAVKDVASALGELINTTKTASGKQVNDPSMQDLKESARVCNTFLCNEFIFVFFYLFCNCCLCMLL